MNFKALFFILILSPLFAQVQNNTQTFQPLKKGVLHRLNIQQLGHLTPEFVQLGRFSKAQGEEFEVRTHSEYGTPRMMSGLLTKASNDDPEQVAIDFIEQNRAVFMLHPDDQFITVSSHGDNLGQTHIRLRLTHGGLEVWPAEMMIHLNEKGMIHTVNGVYRSPVTNLKTAMNVKPSMSVNQAVARAVEYLDEKRSFPSDGETHVELIIYDWHVESPVLAYKIHVHSETDILLNREIFVDAQSGEVLNDIDKVCSGRPSLSGAVDCTVYPTLSGNQPATVRGYDDNGTIYLINTSKQMFSAPLNPDTLAGTIYIIETDHTNQGTGFAQDPNGDRDFGDNSNTHAAGCAAYMVSTTYDWLLSTFNRNSWDGNGSAFKVFVNFRSDPNEGLDNAFWTGKELVFGDGGQITRNLAFTLDVATHEICHAITSSSADLVYQFQSGALNEAFSDMYGATQDDGDWLLGEDIIRSEVFGSPGLRDMSNPHQGKQTGDFNHGWQPAHMDEFQNLQASVDSGGVHINSGIPNHAYYKLASAIGRPKAIQIMHRTLTVYLTRNSQFSDFRSLAEKAAGDLYGTSEQTAVSNAFNEVGIGGSTQTPGTTAESTLYYPFTSSFEYYGLSYNSTFYISNTTDSTITGKATAYDASGVSTGSFDFIIDPHATIGGSASAADQWIKVTASGKVIGAYQHMTSDGSSWSMIPATPFISNGLFIPHVATNTQKFWTVGALANVRETESSLIYVDNLDSAWTVDVNQNGEAIAFDFEEVLYGVYPDVSSLGGLWGFFLNYDLNTSKVLEQNITGAEIFGRKDANMAAGLIVDATSGRSILFTHVAANTQTFWTGYSVVNMTGETARVQINAYNGSGALVASSVQSIPPYGKLLRVTGDALVPTGTSWFIISGLSETTVLSGMELFGSQDDRQLAGFQATPMVGKKFYFPFVISGSQYRPGNFDGLTPNWTGISVINPNGVDVSVNFKVYRDDGNWVSGSTTIRPYNKLLGTISDLFGVTDFYGYVEIESSLPVAGFSLSGFTDQKEMAANPMVFTE